MSELCTVTVNANLTFPASRYKQYSTGETWGDFYCQGVTHRKRNVFVNEMKERSHYKCVLLRFASCINHFSCSFACLHLNNVERMPVREGWFLASNKVYIWPINKLTCPITAALMVLPVFLKNPSLLEMF